MSVQIITGDCLEAMRGMSDQSAHCCITSPPYFGLRDYGVDGQIGLESSPAEFVAKLVDVFREVRRVLRDDGTLWLNLGDSYARPLAKGGSGPGGKNREWYGENYGDAGGAGVPAGLKPKDLIGIPWRVAFALQADGWYLRQDIIWHKPNPMPESVRDRCTKAHEYLFLLSKSERYYFDSEAMREPAVAKTPAGNGFAGRQGGAAHMPMSGGAGSSEPWRPRSKRNSFSRQTATTPPPGTKPQHRPGRDDVDYSETRNRRSVWTVATRSFKGAHFATYPPALIEPCGLAGCPVGGTVLDPFGGAGTTGVVAQRHGRNAVLCELNPEYAAIADARIAAAQAAAEKGAEPVRQPDLFGSGA